MSATVLVFTLNEEINLRACLDSLRWCDDVIIVDSFSADKTQEIANDYGARFIQHEFTGFGTQRNWALKHAGARYDWVLILDADERVTESLAQEILEITKSDVKEVGAFRVRRRFYLWGKWLRYSSLYPTWVVRLVNRNKVNYINRGHAETQKVDGKIESLKNDLIDENSKGIEEWFERQNRYSSKDARYELEIEERSLELYKIISIDPIVRRTILKRIAAKLPGRTILYFLYVYILRRGFLDGKDGFVFCRMRAVYQTMISIKKYDAKKSLK